jgi:hypothetical protein
MNYIEQYIREAAERRGINPDIAVRVAMSEGGLTDPYQQSKIHTFYGREESFGPFQLNIRGGLGQDALKLGIDPRKDWKRGVDFALDNVARSRSWEPFHGAANTGIANNAGLGKSSRPIGVSLANTSVPDAALASAAGYNVGDPNPGMDVQPGLSAPALPATPGVPAAPAAPGTTAGAGGNLANIMSGLGTLVAGLGSRSASDPSANQLTPSSIDANIPSASAAAQMMAALLANRRKRYGISLNSGGPGGV